jgi:hypothetical protein
MYTLPEILNVGVGVGVGVFVGVGVGVGVFVGVGVGVFVGVGVGVGVNVGVALGKGANTASIPLIIGGSEVKPVKEILSTPSVTVTKAVLITAVFSAPAVAKTSRLGNTVFPSIATENTRLPTALFDANVSAKWRLTIKSPFPVGML